MPKINVNLNEVEDVSKPIPAGQYVVRILKAEKATGAESGKDYIHWEVEVVEGESKGRHLFFNTSLQEQSLWNLKKLLEAAKVVTNKDGSFNTEDAIGAEFTAVVGQREYEGKVGNEVTDYLGV